MRIRPSGAAKAYRRLLRLLPRPLRERFGADMESAFADRLGRASSRRERAWIWARAVADILTHALLERLENAVSHDDKGGEGMKTMGQDARWAARGLRRSPLFAAMAVLTLALGIGAATATFSVVDTVLMKPMPFPDSDRLVAVWPETNFNVAMVEEVLAAAPALETATGISGWNLTLTGVGDPIEVEANRVSPSHFRVLGVSPLLGRGFEVADGLPGATGVVVLSHGFWMRMFGGDPGVIGRVLQLSGADADTRTVVGVMPPAFREVVGRPSMWVPLVGDPGLAAEQDPSWYVNTRVARLAPGATLEQAQTQLRAYARTLHERLPARFADEDVLGATIRPLRAHATHGFGSVLWVALGAVSLVLLIACVNVANLTLARGEARARDLAVRAALGADRGRVARMLLAESALLGLLGGALGVGMSFGLVGLVVSLAPADFPRVDDIGVSGLALGFALVTTLSATLIAGLVPAIRLSRVDATASLGGTTRAASGRRGSRLSLTLVGAEMALAVMVAVGSALMLRSLEKLTSVDTGLDAGGVLVMRTAPPESRYSDVATSVSYNREILERVTALPGIERAGTIHLLPGTSNNWNFPTWPEGVQQPEDEPVPSVNFRVVSPGYFATVGVPLLRGRDLSPSDDTNGERVMVVNQAFVDRFWPDRDPLGRSANLLRRTGAPYRVVGVVGNVRQSGFADEPLPEVYVTQGQWGWSLSVWVMARVRSGTPVEHAAAVRDAIWSVDADVPISDVTDLAAVFDRSAETTRFLALALSSFGLLALLLGAIGVFGVTAFTVGRRIPEFGVRIALGSSRIDVLRTALATCLTPVVIGLSIGIVGALGSGTALTSVLYGIEPHDPTTLGAAAATLLGVALLAALLPAWRASRVDPVSVLGSD